MYLRYVHSFRAVAIVVIVAGHVLLVPQWETQRHTKDFLLDLLDGGTVLFVFVAGFLFEHLSDRYRYGNYLRKKINNVVLPYVVILLPLVLYRVFISDPSTNYPELADTNAMYQVGWFMVKGGATVNYPLWFIPMIILFYLAAPWFIQFVRHPHLYLLLVVLLPLSMLFHRNSELDTLGIAVYFLPAYLVGMLASYFRARLEPLAARGWPWLLGGYLTAVLAQFTLADHHGNYYGRQPFSQEHGLIDWTLPQKLLLCAAILSLLCRFESVLADRLKFLGDVSFTVFFLHGYVLALLQIGYFALAPPPAGDLVLWLTLTGVTLAVTIGVTALTKRALGARSRYLIGS